MRGARAWAAGGVLVVAAPWIVAALVPGQQRYVLHILVFTALFAALALSYDLVVGHVGSLSLAHPAFFWIGAYAAALLATAARWRFPASLGAGLRLQIVTLPQYYWLVVAALGLTAALYRGLTTFRIGRAFIAVRDNEQLAAAAGINPLKYRMLAFVTGAAVAGGVGALYAHYLTVLCPEELTIGLTVNLLVILFLGGVGSLRGVLIGAVLFTALPEILRVAPTWRLAIYGLLLLTIVIRAPEGLDAWLRGRRRGPAANG